MEERITTDMGGMNPAAAAAMLGQGPAVQIVSGLISEAVRVGASDIHIEPRKTGLEVRMRIDGLLYEARNLHKELQDTVISRVKVMAELDINERRLPQDGRIAINLDGRLVDLRVSTMPVLYGEKIVMRVLDRGMSVRTLDQLDFSTENRTRFESLIRTPHGLILVTGPTGSGKTTTLYSALNTLRDKKTNIMTCEDPVEYDMDGINQSAVFDKVGLTFARQLRSILRQDPDIVLVGEIRDAETAEIAFRAAMTGHLVLSTLHSNDAPTTVTRLLDMGVPPFLITSSLSGIVAQRLARRLCPHCRQPAPATTQQAAMLDLEVGEKIFNAVGCKACGESGYRGRLAIHEVLAVDEAFSRLIMQQASAGELRAGAVRTGMTSIRHDARAKVRAGVTSVEEVARQVYTHDDEV